MKFFSSFILSLALLPFAFGGQRVANTTLSFPDQPPVSVIEVEDAFPGLGFSQPLCLRSPDGARKRLFVCEKGGDLELISDVTANPPRKTIFLDLDQILSGRGESLLTSSEQGLLSVAFHPEYAENGEFFLVYNVRRGGVNYQRLSRWLDPNRSDSVADPGSEEILIEIRNDASNHNGGDIHFGPDGYLYMSWGDEGRANDTLNNGQFLDKDFWASITRIDVDLEPEDYGQSDGTGGDDENLRPNFHRAIRLVNGNPLYEIPADNPWVGATSFNGVPVDPSEVRTEFFAVGLRNPWRMSFDGEDLWVADVGQGAKEEVVLARAGSNHGWGWYEGSLNGPKFGNRINGAERTDSQHVPPLWDYSHGSGEFQGNSVTGGMVYRGDSIPVLKGSYIFADYVSGHVWALKRGADGEAPAVERIAGANRIAAFGADPSNADVLMADLGSGRIQRLVSRDLSSGFPIHLSETGIFSDLGSLTPNPGVVPYEMNLPFWSDHAIKRRWFAIKNTTDLIEYAKDSPWRFPNGMVWVKHFELEMERGNPSTQRRVETRVLVRNQTGVPTQVSLLPEGSRARYLVPGDSADEQIWMQPEFDDSGWAEANAGFGYDENSTYLAEFGSGGDLGSRLNGVNTTMYTRFTFDVGEAESLSGLTLRMKYDDGFAAFLNGQRIASANAPDELGWRSTATGDHPDGSARSFQDFTVDATLLREGGNLLAIQGLNNGIGSSDMLLEPELVGTRILDPVDRVYGVSYRWNESGTEATLVGSAGEDIDYLITAPEGIRKQTWNIPSRSSCLACHNPQAGLALSFNTAQLNRPGELEGESGNFLDLLSSAGYLHGNPRLDFPLPRHVAPLETAFSLEARIRSYLDVNCAYCHQKGGVHPESWFGGSSLSMHDTHLINGPALGGILNPDDRLVVPGDPERSLILSRISASNGYTRMPPLAANESDPAAIRLLTDWIISEAEIETDYSAWRVARFGNGTSPEGEPSGDPDGDGFSNRKEFLALTNPNDGKDFLVTDFRFSGGEILIDLPAIPGRSVLIERSGDLIEWSPWRVPGNDGIPGNPVESPLILRATPNGEGAFFRFQIRER